jgi:hypothetical protein
MPEPIVPDSYWVTDAFAAGEYPGARFIATAEERVRSFERARIKLFVDLTHSSDYLSPYETFLRSARRVSHPIVDNSVPTVVDMQATLDTIDGALSDGETVYVHCWGGIGRTGLVVGCWLVRHGSTYDEAIDRIAELRRPTPDFDRDPLAPQTQEQRAFVGGWIHEERGLGP